VPVVIKDCFETAGIRTTAGFPPLADYVPEEDAVVVARLPGFPPSIRHLNSVGPLARSVDDLELALKVLVRPGRDWEGAPVPLGDALWKPLDYLTIGWTDDFGGGPVVVVPATLPDQGLPIGVRLVGRCWTEMELLGVARAISGVLPPLSRPPMAS
jgi:Asp-tRNA(Asn)/Glu-tRNA(Gln) amidotransferase A subunit family amidase